MFRFAAMMLFGGAAMAQAGSFSEESCTEFFKTMKRLDGPVPPAEYVEGCDSVCGKVREMKEYWKNGENAAWACEQGQKYGCAWSTAVPAVTLADIGC
mmetsp:Transcript_69939/g.202692  ORF Transcript_69939/g.202692 Transcript_69939/m.202692 type:complete len:98 (+) Transcript_69939:77-370(+)